MRNPRRLHPQRYKLISNLAADAVYPPLTLNLNTIEQANQWLPGFMDEYNARFAVAPQSEVDAHRKELPQNAQLEFILSHQHLRKLSKQLELSYNNEIFQIQTKSPSYALRHAAITVCDNRGTITLLYQGKPLPYNRFNKHNRPAPIVDTKLVNTFFEKNKTHPYKPPPTHPWRKTYKAA